MSVTERRGAFIDSVSTFGSENFPDKLTYLLAIVPPAYMEKAFPGFLLEITLQEHMKETLQPMYPPLK